VSQKTARARIQEPVLRALLALVNGGMRDVGLTLSDRDYWPVLWAFRPEVERRIPGPGERVVAVMLPDHAPWASATPPPEAVAAVQICPTTAEVEAFEFDGPGGRVTVRRAGSLGGA
jgi:hypothetical protein